MQRTAMGCVRRRGGEAPVNVTVNVSDAQDLQRDVLRLSRAGPRAYAASAVSFPRSVLKRPASPGRLNARRHLRFGQLNIEITKAEGICEHSEVGWACNPRRSSRSVPRDWDTGND